MKHFLWIAFVFVTMARTGVASQPTTELIQAAAHGQTARIQDLLNEGAQVNGTHPLTGWTALTAAAYYGYPETVKILLDAGADPNIRDFRHGTPLMKAVTLGMYEDKNDLLKRKSEVVRALLHAGADPQAKDPFGDTPWQAALISEEMVLVDVFDEAGVKGVREMKLLHAVSHQNVQEVEALIAKGADVNARDEFGWDALSEAVLADNIEIVRLLIDAHADVNATYPNGWTPIAIARVYDRQDIVRLLLDSPQSRKGQEE